MVYGLGPSHSVSYHWCGFEVSFQNWLVACVCVCACACSCARARVSVCVCVCLSGMCEWVCVTVGVWGGVGTSGMSNFDINLQNYGTWRHVR